MPSNPTRSATGKLTGYFEPLIAGSLRNEGAYKYPIYGIPNDMYMVDSRTVAGQSSRWLKVSQGKLIGAEAGASGARQYKIDLTGMSPNNRDKRYRVRIVGGTVVPYYKRQQIDEDIELAARQAIAREDKATVTITLELVPSEEGTHVDFTLYSSLKIP